jgi:hypothetical protein
MKDEGELLTTMYTTQVARSAHYENLRASLGSLVVAVAAALIAFVANDNLLSRADAFSGALVALLGAFGVGGSILHTRRSSHHGRRAGEYRNALDRMFPNVGVNVVKTVVPRGKRTRLGTVWAGMHAVILLIGVVIVVLAMR